MDTVKKYPESHIKKNESPSAIEDQMDGKQSLVRDDQVFGMRDSHVTRPIGWAVSCDTTYGPSGVGSNSTAAMRDTESLERYNMKHKRRGLAVIINNEYFKNNLPRRVGTQKDGEDLEEALEKLGFEVDYCKDYSAAEILEKLEKVSKEVDHSDADCLFVAVMTHGEQGGVLHAKDKDYKVDTVWKTFTADKVHSLAGKPKIFLFQACRGDKYEKSHVIETDSAPETAKYAIPTMADFVLAYSTMEGFYSFREENGSWFVQEFCNELRANGRRRDLLTTLTFTLRRVAFERGYTPDDKDMHEEKQTFVVVSTLTKLVFFD